MRENTGAKSIQPSALKQPSAPQDSQAISVSFSKDLATQLLDLMKRVTKDDVSPASVNAACNCASEIHKILALNYRMKKDGV